MPRRRHSGPLLTVLTTLTLAASLAACSGDGDPDSSPSASDTPVAGEVAECDVEVALTGAVEVEWTGEGEVSQRGESDTGDGPEATYVSDDRKNQLTVLSAGPGFEPSVTLGVGQRVFVSNPAAVQGVAADEDGAKATADVELQDADGEVAELVAQFTCG